MKRKKLQESRKGLLGEKKATSERGSREGGDKRR
jgi:hypothetical protein